MSATWRDTARSVRFFFVDYRAAFPLLLFLLHIRVWTLVLAVAATLMLYALERYGYTVPVFLRLVRVWFAGSKKYSRPWWRK